MIYDFCDLTFFTFLPYRTLDYIFVGGNVTVQAAKILPTIDRSCSSAAQCDEGVTSSTNKTSPEDIVEVNTAEELGPAIATGSESKAQDAANASASIVAAAASDSSQPQSLTREPLDRNLGTISGGIGNERGEALLATHDAPVSAAVSLEGSCPLQVQLRESQPSADWPSDHFMVLVDLVFGEVETDSEVDCSEK